MDEITQVKKARKKQGDRVIPKFRLTQIKLERIEEVIAGYSKHGAPVKFDELALEVNVPRDAVSLTNGFLSDLGILEGEGTSLKSLANSGRRLGNAITFNNESERVEIWRKIIIGNDHCIKFIRSLDQRDKVSRKDFRSNIMRIAGYLDPEIHEKKVGANALIELFTQVGYVNKDGSKTKGYYSISSEFKEDLQKQQNDNNVQNTNIFINNRFINDLGKIHHKEFDATRLIKYCKEINENFQRENYFSFLFVCRAILDHCPPIFGDYPNFESLGDQLPHKNSLKELLYV